MHRILAALLAVSSCASIAQAQSTDPALAGPPFTLSQALELAGASSPMLEAASAGLRSATAARTVAGLRPNPSIVTQTENIAGSGQYRGARSAETTAGLELPIELGGKRSARIAVADARGRSAACRHPGLYGGGCGRAPVVDRPRAGCPCRRGTPSGPRSRAGRTGFPDGGTARRCRQDQCRGGGGARNAHPRGRAR